MKSESLNKNNKNLIFYVHEVFIKIKSKCKFPSWFELRT